MLLFPTHKNFPDCLEDEVLEEVRDAGRVVEGVLVDQDAVLAPIALVQQVGARGVQAVVQGRETQVRVDSSKKFREL